MENRTTFTARLIGKLSQSDIDEIMMAYDLSKEAHRTHKRDGGERYFEHPRAGALILIDELKIYDKDSIIAFLLHDAGEDSGIFGNITAGYDEFVRTATFRLGKIFNSNVATLVIGLTKPSVDGEKFKTKEEMMSFYIKGLSDPRLFLLKMVDRLHNLRSLTGTTESKKAKTIKETADVYISMIKDFLVKNISTKEELSLFQEIGKICGEEILPTQTFEVLCQKWEESEYEEDWGVSVRPDGYSLHLNDENLKSFIKKYWDGMPEKTPDCYTRPDGTPYICKVTKEIYEEVRNATVNGEYGKHYFDEHPVGGKDGWLRSEENKVLSV